MKIDVEAVLSLPAYAGATVIAGRNGMNRSAVDFKGANHLVHA
ncbi:hypothetical protein [Exiguobacterium sp. SH0S1]|nr:hypothetical protein [Exiguobacterium sp. SH0S1]